MLVVAKYVIRFKHSNPTCRYVQQLRPQITLMAVTVLIRITITVAIIVTSNWTRTRDWNKNNLDGQWFFPCGTAFRLDFYGIYCFRLRDWSQSMREDIFSHIVWDRSCVTWDMNRIWGLLAPFIFYFLHSSYGYKTKKTSNAAFWTSKRESCLASVFSEQICLRFRVDR